MMLSHDYIKFLIGLIAILNFAVRKRGKTGDGGKMMQSLDREPEEHDWVLPQEEEWSPPSASNPTTSKANTTTDACVDVNSKLPVRRLADIEGDFMPITSPSGDRVYAKVKEIQRMTGSLQSVRGASRRSNHGRHIVCAS